MLPDAGGLLAKALNARLGGLAAEHGEAVATAVDDMRSGRLHQTVLTNVGETVDTRSRTVDRKVRDIDRDTRRAVRSVKEGVGLDYFRYRVEQAGDGADTIEVRTEVAALFSIPEVGDELDKAATKWVQQQFAVHDAAACLVSSTTSSPTATVEEAKSP